MLKIENCPQAAATYLVERMLLNQNRGTTILLEAPLKQIETSYHKDGRLGVERRRSPELFLFASYLPLLLATNIPEEDNSGIFVLVACCVLAFFLFGGRRSKQIKD